MKFLNSLLPIFPPISKNLSRDLLDITMFGNLLDKTEETINGFRVYQIFVQRFLSPLTPYRELLIKHSMGSGKTCTAFLILLTYYQPSVHNCIFLANNKSQIKNLKSILKTCVSYLTSSKDYEKKILANYIDSNIRYLTFDSVNKLDVKDLLQNVKIIIIDEAHTIHNKTAEGTLYSNMMKLLDGARRRGIRTVLMSGTPITNHFSKLFQLMDLILPKELRFEMYEKEKLGHTYDIGDEEEPENEAFINNLYFEKNGEVKAEAIEEINKRLFGRVSSFQIITRATRLIEVGDYYNFKTRKGEEIRSNDTSRTKVFINYMTGIQNNLYRKLINETLTEQNELSLAFYAPALTKKDIRITEKQHVSFLATEIRKIVSNPKLLKEHSILYYNVLREMGELDVFHERKSEAAFYFNDLIQGSANILFTLILIQYHFEYLVDNEAISKLLMDIKKGKAVKKKRFSVISSSFGTINDNEIDKVIQIYSHEDNKYGEYLRLIVGSKKIALGYNLINGRQAHIVIQWNSPLMNQAVARIIRGKTNFHDSSENFVRVYKHFVVPRALTTQKPVLFERRLKRVEEKENRNAKILHLLDKIAVDCFINRKYHISNPKLDFTTECNFLKCSENYDCGEFDSKIVTKTDNSFLFSEDINKIRQLQEIISRLIKKNVYSINLNDLKQVCQNDFTPNEFLYYLLKTILQQTLFEDSLGFIKTIGCINDVIYVKNKPFISSELDAISNLTYPQHLVYNYSPVFIDQFFIREKERDSIESFFKLRNKTGLKTTYDELNILNKVWIFETIFPQSSVNNIIKQVVEEIEKPNFLINPSISDKDIIMVHKIISEFHLKDHKVKKPEDLVEGLRIYTSFDDKWKEASLSFPLALDLAKQLLSKDTIEETKREVATMNFIFEKDSKGVIKRKTLGDKKRKGRTCSTMRRADLDEYFEQYVNLIETNESRENNITNFLEQKFNIEIDETFNKKAKIEELRRRYRKERTIDEACEFLYGMQQSLFKE